MEKKREKVYLETSVVSYYTGRPSRDLITAAHQEVTRIWWERELVKYDVFISNYVIEEASQGDPILAKKRIDALNGFQMLNKIDGIKILSDAYIKATSLPEKARVDTLHMSIATLYQVDFMLSWNCKHIVNAHIIAIITNVNEEFGLQSPVICTPYELLEDGYV